MVATTLGISIAIPGSSSRKKSIFFIQSLSSQAAIVSFSSRRGNSANTPAPTKEIHKKTLSHKNLEEDDDIDEDAFQALFSQLEEDLKNDGLIGGDAEDDFLSEEELAKLEHELAEALEEDELLGALGSMAYGLWTMEITVTKMSNNNLIMWMMIKRGGKPDKAQELAIQEIGLCSENWSVED